MVDLSLASFVLTCRKQWFPLDLIGSGGPWVCPADYSFWQPQKTLFSNGTQMFLDNHTYYFSGMQKTFCGTSASWFLPGVPRAPRVLWVPRVLGVPTTLPSVPRAGGAGGGVYGGHIHMAHVAGPYGTCASKMICAKTKRGPPHMSGASVSTHGPPAVSQEVPLGQPCMLASHLGGLLGHLPQTLWIHVYHDTVQCHIPSTAIQYHHIGSHGIPLDSIIRPTYLFEGN